MRVHQQDDDLGETHGIKRVRYRELLQLPFDPRATAQSGGVVDPEALIPPHQIDGDGVAGDAGLGPGQQPLLAEQPIDQRRFSRIGAADHRDADRLAICIWRVDFTGRGRRRRRLGQRLAQGGIEIGQAFPVLGGDRDRLPETELICLQQAGLGGPPLALVGDDNRGLAGFAHEISKGAVGRCRACAGINEEHHCISGSDGGPRLLLHAGGQALRSSLFEARRIDGDERQVTQPRLRFAPIARDAGEVIDQCDALADKTIEQRRLADIRPSDNGDRESHDHAERVSDTLYCPVAVRSAISAARADRAKRRRRTGPAPTRARRPPPVAVASAADQAIGPAIAPGPVAFVPQVAFVPAEP